MENHIEIFHFIYDSTFLFYRYNHCLIFGVALKMIFLREQVGSFLPFPSSEDHHSWLKYEIYCVAPSSDFLLLLIWFRRYDFCLSFFVPNQTAFQNGKQPGVLLINDVGQLFLCKQTVHLPKGQARDRSSLPGTSRIRFRDGWTLCRRSRQFWSTRKL